MAPSRTRIRWSSRLRSSSVRSGCGIRFSGKTKSPAQMRGASGRVHVFVTTGGLAFFNLVASGPKSLQVRRGYGSHPRLVKRRQPGQPAPDVPAVLDVIVAELLTERRFFVREDE